MRAQTPAQPTKATCPHFYKYSKPEHLERLKVIILEHKLYIPSLPELNDPTDGRPRLAPLSEDQMFSFLYEDFLKRNPGLTWQAQEKGELTIRFNVRHHGPKTLLRVMVDILNRHLDGYRVYSMSMRHDNLNLWAKYAADHSGYCLEFANQGPLFMHAMEVTYGDSLQMDVTNKEHRSGYWFFSKRPEWSNEEEVRLVTPPVNDPMVNFNPAWLTRIILGMNMSEAHRSLVCEWAEQRRPKLTVVSAYYDQLTQMLGLKACSP
jgi:hypothetical protein